ncbi:DUF6915 family protein [Pelagivirga sediminicola]|uniref:DUF6915 family protein n=1 Tax=Pelagivirga sediminicola TaxID=2170575 RepID=UPI001FAFBB04|nr:hypothetical protein [Pelagivirga sediminicola]
MAHPLHHAESSARKFGGVPSDYQAVHDWFDASKEHLALFTHRAMRHHAQGLYEAERVFGLSLTNSAGREIPVRWIGEQHIREDCQGRIPSMADWLRRIQPEPWMAMAISTGILAMSPAATQGLPGHLKSPPAERFLV